MPGADHIVERADPRLARRLLKCDDHARFAPAHAFGQEGRGEDGLARSGRPRDQQRIARRQAAAQHFVEARHAHGQPHFAARRRGGHRRLPGIAANERRRKDFDPGAGDAEGMHPGTGRLAAHFQNLHLAHHRIAVDALLQRQQAVGHREDRDGFALRQIFPDQEGGGLPAAQLYAELLR